MIQTPAGPALEVAPPTRTTAIDDTRATMPDVPTEAMKRLRGCSHEPIRHVQCRFQQGVLILCGQVPTFYMKQVAQELLRSMKQVETIDNRLSVPERSMRDSHPWKEGSSGAWDDERGQSNDR